GVCRAADCRERKRSESIVRVCEWELMTAASPLPVLQDAAADNGQVRAARVALVGNPNTGKTSLFNRLTGLRAKTANYPGITVDLRKGRMRLPRGEAELIDLPGLYSLDVL